MSSLTPEIAGSLPRYFAWLYADEAMRPLLQLLFELENEIRGPVRAGIEHTVAHVRLEWWREELERFVAGKPVHPLTRAMAGKPFDAGGLVDTAAWDLSRATFSTQDEITGYCTRWASAVTQPAAQTVAHAEIGRSLGVILRELELLSDLATDARLGQLRLPLDDLAAAQIDPDALAKPPWPEKLTTWLRARHRFLRARLAEISNDIPRAAQAPLRGLLVWAALARRQSLRIEHAMPNVLPPGRAVLLSDMWIAWRTARRALRGRWQMPND